MSANPVISAERLEEIRTLRAGITPGPWTVADSFRADQALALVACEDGLVRGVISPKPPFKTAHNNLKFIATAPQIADDCLALAEENARLQAELARLEAIIAAWNGFADDLGTGILEALTPDTARLSSDGARHE